MPILCGVEVSFRIVNIYSCFAQLWLRYRLDGMVCDVCSAFNGISLDNKYIDPPHKDRSPADLIEELRLRKIDCKEIEAIIEDRQTLGKISSLRILSANISRRCTDLLSSRGDQLLQLPTIISRLPLCPLTSWKQTKELVELSKKDWKTIGRCWKANSKLVLSVNATFDLIEYH